jgi:hypothetical protein
VAYGVIKQTNPNAVVHLSAFTYFWDANYGRTPFFSLLMDEIQRDSRAALNNYYFDVASANLYFRVDNVYDLIAWHHNEMRARGFDKPIWLTETNAAPSSDPTWPVANPTFPITLDEQAAYIPQAFAMALAAGANRIAMYKMIDTPGDRAANPEPFGLVRDDGSRRPAFTAYQVAANYLSGFTGATLDHRDELYAQVTVRRGEATTTVLWARSPAPVQVQVPARSTQAILADAFGSTRTVTPSDGVYVIDLPGCTQPTCAIGGAPRLLVEGAPAAAIPQVTAAPAQSTGEPVIQPTSEPTNTPTPTDQPTAIPTVRPTHISTAAPAVQPTHEPTIQRTRQPTPAPTLPHLSASSEVSAVLITCGLLLGLFFVAFVLVRLSSSNRGDPS